MLSPAVLFSLLGVVGVIGFLGNVMACLLASHPRMKESYSVYLTYLSVVNTLDLIMTVVDSANGRWGLTQTWPVPAWVSCNLYKAAREWVADMTLMGLMAFTFDRYIVVVLPRFMTDVGKRFRARMLCLALTLITCLVAVPYLAMLGVVTSSTLVSFCYSREWHSAIYYIKTVLLRLLPCAVVVYLAGHTGLFLIRRSWSTTAAAAAEVEAEEVEEVREGTAAEQPKNDDDVTKVDWSLLVVTVMSIVTRLPREIHQLLTSVFFYQAASGDSSVMAVAKPLARTEDAVTMITCVNLSSNFYVMVITSPVFRRMMPEAVRKCFRPPTPPQRIELPGDRREFTASVDGSALEVTSGQIVDLHALNRQWTLDRAARPPSIASTCSGCSRHTEEEDHEEFTNGNAATCTSTDGYPLDSIWEAHVQRETAPALVEERPNWERRRRGEAVGQEEETLGRKDRKDKGFRASLSCLHRKRNRGIRATKGKGAFIAKCYAKKTASDGDISKCVADFALNPGEETGASLSVIRDGEELQSNSASERRGRSGSFSEDASHQDSVRSTVNPDDGKEVNPGDKAVNDQDIQQRPASEE